jgi:hypothetical protein
MAATRLSLSLVPRAYPSCLSVRLLRSRARPSLITVLRHVRALTKRNVRLIPCRYLIVVEWPIRNIQ